MVAVMPTAVVVTTVVVTAVGSGPARRRAGRSPQYTRGARGRVAGIGRIARIGRVGSFTRASFGTV